MADGCMTLTFIIQWPGHTPLGGGGRGLSPHYTMARPGHPSDRVQRGQASADGCMTQTLPLIHT